ncbi:hypothetical protein D3C72_685440 [compost metagenome]
MVTFLIFKTSYNSLEFRTYLPTKAEVLIPVADGFATASVKTPVFTGYNTFRLLWKSSCIFSTGNAGSVVTASL